VIEIARRDKIEIDDIRYKRHMESLNDTVKKCRENWKTTYKA
jgi:hypothetical protein